MALNLCESDLLSADILVL